MSNKLYEENDIQDIADAIRSKNGSSDTYMVSEMAQAVLDIPTGTTPTGTKQIAIDSAGVTTENISAYASVEITVPQGEYKPQLSTTMTPSISVSNGGLITASNLTQVLQDWTKEDLTEGYVEASDVSAKATITGGSATHQLQTVSGQTVTPTTSQQEIAVQGDFVTGSLKVGAIPSQYIIPTGTKSITANGTGIDVTQYASVDVNVSGGGNELPDFLKNTLTELIDDNGDVTSVVNDGCRSRTALTKIRLIGCTSIGDYAFYGCSNAVTIVLPSLNSNLDAREFQGCTNLEALDIKGYKIGFSGSANPPWLNDAKLDTIILRKSDSIVTLSPPSGVAYTFNGTPFASNGSGGTLYVPSALVNSYKTGTNWATWFADNGNHNNQVKAIEGSQYENYYADGTPIS